MVQRIFAMSQRQVGAFTIASRLNAEGLSLRGRPWAKNTILNILSSKVYMGEVIFNRFDRKRRQPRPESEWLRVQAHAPIVSREQWTEVQGGLAARVPTEGVAPGNAGHAFAGLMRCDLCGNALMMATGTGRGGKIYHYYACRRGCWSCASPRGGNRACTRCWRCTARTRQACTRWARGCAS